MENYTHFLRYSSTVSTCLFVCFLSAAPSEPGLPEVHTIRGDEMTLTWTEPRHHGGRPMLGYHVEVREDFDLPWSRVTTEPIPDTTHRVTGLRPGQEYEFRVVGVTEIGVGRPSEPSFPPKMAREPAGECNMKLIIWNIDIISF